MEHEQATRMAEEMELPEPAGYGVEMHGNIVLFASKEEKKAGMSPGAIAMLFTESQAREAIAAALVKFTKEKDAALRACMEAFNSLDGVGSVIEWHGQWEKCNSATVKAKEALDE